MKRIITGLMALLVISVLAAAAAFADSGPTVNSDGSVTTCVTVVDSPAVDAQHYSLKGNSGIGKDEVPVFPADYWQANTSQEPHYAGNATPAQNVDGSPYVDGDSGLHYVSHGSEGLRDWFYFQAAVPAVTHEACSVVPAVPVVSAADCANNGVVTSPADANGVSYGDPVLSADGLTASVTATADQGFTLSAGNGYTLNEDGTATIVLDVPQATGDCNGTPPPPPPPPGGGGNGGGGSTPPPVTTPGAPVTHQAFTL